MKTRLGNPAPSKKLSINLVSSDPLLAEKAARYYARSKKYALILSETPLPENDLDGYVVPFIALSTILYGRERPDTRLPVIAYGPPLRLSEAFSAGCRDYLKEPWDMAELDIRLNRVMRLAARQETEAQVTGNRLVTALGRVALKPNEARILKALLKARGEAVSREVLFYAIWGKVKNSSSRVVDVHVSALRKKIKGVADWEISQVRGEGYIIS